MQLAVGPWRGVRAAFVAGVCVTCSVVGHVAAGGGLPGAVTLAGVWVAVAVVAYRLSAARWTFGRLFLVLGGGQALLHPTFDLAAPAPHAAIPSTMTAAHAPLGTASWTMMAAHLAAAVVLAVVMAYGDRALWRIAAAVQALLRPLSHRGRGVDVVPPAAPALRPLAAYPLDLPVPLGADIAPAAERAPPLRSH